MKLINATPSPYGRKVAIALKEKSIPYEVQYDIPWADGTCTPDYSPLQQLPILLTDDGQSIYDSVYILDWLELVYPTPALLPADVGARLKDMQLRMLSERLVEIASLIVFEAQRPEPSQAWLARQTRKIDTGLAEVSRLVGDRAPGPADPITLGDIATGAMLRMFEFMIELGVVEGMPQFLWREAYRNLARYATALEARPSFQQTQPVMFQLNLKEVVD